MDNLRQQILERGYCVIPQLFPPSLLDEVAAEIEAYSGGGGRRHPCDGGYSIPAFLDCSGLGRTAALKDHPALRAALDAIFGGDNAYRFCSHNDIGVNRIVGWHKDRLNGAYAKYQITPLWSTTQEGERHEIVKVLIYLENHPDGRDGLQLVPGSHFRQDLATGGARAVATQLGDVVIFDQRITHRGAAAATVPPGRRILVSFGFGRNNTFTDEFERGTIARQTDQSRK